MGVRTAAARLGLGLAAANARKKIMGSSNNLPLFMRRFSTLAATVADVGKKKGVNLGSGSGLESEMESELNKEKTLYLCFTEQSYCGSAQYVNHVVRPIRLNGNNADAEDEEVYLPEAAYKRFKLTDQSLHKKWDYSICFGSRIVFAFGCRQTRHLCWIDPTTRPIKFHLSSARKTKIKRLSADKHQIVLGELDHKLYCLDRNFNELAPKSHTFEALDPEKDLEWRTLAEPPFIRGIQGIRRRSPARMYGVAFLEGSNKILGWEIHKPGVFCFDVTKPENGWIKSPCSFGDKIPFLNNPKPYVIQCHHPDIGDFHLAFEFCHEDEPLCVPAYFMSNNCDLFHPIKPIQLPDFCVEYSEFDDDIADCDPPSFNYDLGLGPLSWVDSHFAVVHLEPKKFCLILHKFFYEDCSRPRNTGIICLLTFEYDIIPKNNTTLEDDKPAFDIQTCLLEKRRFRYCSRQLRKPDETRSHSVELEGALLL